jgi:hypothetical protein
MVDRAIGPRFTQSGFSARRFVTAIDAAQQRA